jgi:hypothetical protein
VVGKECPGGVDAHTHLVHQGLAERVGFPVWVDDFWSGSRAAIAGGITTVGNMTYPVPDEGGTEETPGAAITREMAGAAGEAAVDWFLHPVVLHPAALSEGEVGALAGARHASIKMFLADPDLAADEPALLAAAAAAQAAGSVTLLHCEDGMMLAQASEQLIAAGRGAVANFPDARPVAAEVAAVDQAIGIARRTGARVYIMHLSSAAALDRCRRGRAAGTRIGCGCRTGAEHCPGSRACALAAAVVEGQRDRDDRNGSHQPQQQHCLLQAQALVCPAGMSRFGARTPDRLPRADMDLLTRRHLLAGCQSGEYGQPRGQCRVTADQIVFNRVQGLLLPRAQAHHWSPHRFAAAPAVAATWRASR